MGWKNKRRNMTGSQVTVATVIWLAIVYVLYKHITFTKIQECYGMWLQRKYWTDYNIVEALAWLTKAIIIIPGLIFKIEIWWLYIFSLVTSTMLVWASEKKLLPTLVGFNTMWIWLSLMILAQHII
jgi:hypothetical protein